ncbi:MAG: proline--tRNA ligase [Candidatus Woesearchaeota archaeon]
MAKSDLGITVSKQEDIAQWYEQICLKSQIADFGDVRGTIVIRARGYYMWEQIQAFVNEQIVRALNVDNCYFPLFIPERFFVKEAEHAKGFAPELAWVTTSQGEGGEKAIIRPTSETIIVDNMRKWLRNYRQLPIKVNQWANVVRWEVKQTKLFLRGREFLWQEGHCIYQTQEECEADVKQVLSLYEKLCSDVLALPVFAGEKSPMERFPGAKKTFGIESIMPDGKSLQMGTSHYLGQGFMEAFDVKFMGSDGQEHYPHYNSWGVSTRLLGAVIMMHSDDRGLVLPPKLAKQKVVVIPVKEDDVEYANTVAASCGAMLDDREGYSLGFKLSDTELQGIPLTIIIGARERETKMATVKARDTGEKVQVPVADVPSFVHEQLEQMHTRLFEKAKEWMDSCIVDVQTQDEFEVQLQAGKTVRAYFSGDETAEEQLKERLGITSRLLQEAKTPGVCILTGKKTQTIATFGKSY